MIDDVLDAFEEELAKIASQPKVAPVSGIKGPPKLKTPSIKQQKNDPNIKALFSPQTPKL